MPERPSPQSLRQQMVGLVDDLWESGLLTHQEWHEVREAAQSLSIDEIRRFMLDIASLGKPQA